MRDSVSVEVRRNQVGDELRIPHLRRVHTVLQRPASVSTFFKGDCASSTDDEQACSKEQAQTMNLRVRYKGDLLSLEAKPPVGLIQFLSSNEAEAICIACDMSVHHLRRNQEQPGQ